MTRLTGRHMEFELFTLSFDEYLGMKGFLGKSIGERRAEFEEYLRYGGFPRALTYDDPEAKATYIEGVVAQVVEKGIKARKKVRNVSTFDRVITYVINNFGAPTSLTNLVDHFNNVEGVPVKRETIAGYLRLLELAKVLYKCERFDLKSRRSLRGEEKYYLADFGSTTRATRTRASATGPRSRTCSTSTSAPTATACRSAASASSSAISSAAGTATTRTCRWR